MNIRHLLMVILGVLSLERFSTSDWNHSWTIFGQVIYPTGSQISIPPACRLIVELHDISGSNYLFKTIAQTNIDANVFPIIFNITYMRNVVLPNHIYVLNARIVTEYSNILFVNNKRIAVKLLGGGRTTFIDIPVIPIPCRSKRFSRQFENGFFYYSKCGLSHANGSIIRMARISGKRWRSSSGDY